MVLRRMMSPSLETGAVLDAALSVNYCAIRDCVSAMGVTLVCDEKRPARPVAKFGEGDGVSLSLFEPCRAPIYIALNSPVTLVICNASANERKSGPKSTSIFSKSDC